VQFVVTDGRQSPVHPVRSCPALFAPDLACLSLRRTARIFQRPRTSTCYALACVPFNLNPDRRSAPQFSGMNGACVRADGLYVCMSGPLLTLAPARSPVLSVIAVCVTLQSMLASCKVCAHACIPLPALRKPSNLSQANLSHRTPCPRRKKNGAPPICLCLLFPSRAGPRSCRPFAELTEPRPAQARRQRPLRAQRAGQPEEGAPLLAPHITPGAMCAGSYLRANPAHYTR
jgi:hypothetical protein